MRIENGSLNPEQLEQPETAVTERKAKLRQGSVKEIRNRAREGLQPGTVYCLDNPKMELMDVDIQTIFPAFVIDERLMDTLRRLGPWEKIDEAHWKFVGWNAADAPPLKKDPSQYKKRGGGRAPSHWPWQKIEVKNPQTSLSPEDNAYFQIIINQFGEQSFAMKEFIRLRTGNKPTIHSEASEAVLRLYSLGFLLREEIKEKYHYYVDPRYLKQETDDRNPTT